MINIVQFQINGQNFMQKNLSRVPVVGEMIYLVSKSLTDVNTMSYKQFKVVQISTILRDLTPPEGFISIVDDHYICSVVPVVPEQTKTEAEKPASDEENQGTN